MFARPSRLWWLNLPERGQSIRCRVLSVKKFLRTVWISFVFTHFNTFSFLKHLNLFLLFFFNFLIALNTIFMKIIAFVWIIFVFHFSICYFFSGFLHLRHFSKFIFFITFLCHIYVFYILCHYFTRAKQFKLKFFF